MKVLVTGSSGHLGEALMRTLPGLGHEAIGIDLVPSPFTTFVGSICDRATVVSSHLLALEKAPALGFAKFIITATTPFTRDDAPQLGLDAPAIIARYFPTYPAIYAARGWRMLPTLDRVYINTRARTHLAWHPRYDFARALTKIAAGRDIRSPLSIAIGVKGYHAR